MKTLHISSINNTDKSYFYQIKLTSDIYRFLIFLFGVPTVNLLILNTSKEFMKCRLDNFSMCFILFYVNLSICENK